MTDAVSDSGLGGIAGEVVDVVDVGGMAADVVDAPACSHGFGGDAILIRGVKKGSMRRVLSIEIDKGQRQ